MKILNTKPRPVCRSLTKSDILEFAAVVDGWEFVPQTMIMAEATFTALLDLGCREDKEFLAWLDSLSTKEG